MVHHVGHRHGSHPQPYPGSAKPHSQPTVATFNVPVEKNNPLSGKTIHYDPVRRPTFKELLAAQEARFGTNVVKEWSGTGPVMGITQNRIFENGWSTFRNQPVAEPRYATQIIPPDFKPYPYR